MAFDEWVCFGIPEQTITQASNWIAKLDGQRIDPDEKKAFFEWLDEKPENRWAFEELSELWAKTSLLSNLTDEIESSEVIPMFADVNSQSAPPAPPHLDRDEYFKYQISSYVSLSFIAIGIIFALF